MIICIVKNTAIFEQAIISIVKVFFFYVTEKIHYYHYIVCKKKQTSTLLIFYTVYCYVSNTYFVIHVEDVSFNKLIVYAVIIFFKEVNLQYKENKFKNFSKK